LQGGSQLLGWKDAPPVIDFLKASNLLLLPLYVLLAQGLVNLFRLVRISRRLIEWCCVALLAAWMVPSDNLEWARQQAYLTLGRFVTEQNKPRQLRKIEDEAQRQMELAAIADWARNGGYGAKLLGKSCRADFASVFVTDRTEFRILSRRPIVAAADDVLFLYYLQPGRIKDWCDRFDLQHCLLHSKSDEASLKEFLAGLAVNDEMRQVRQWYIIVDTSVVDFDPAKYGSPQNVAEVVSEHWGKQYRLYRVYKDRILGATTTSNSE
jgi:hypothetical protein